MIRVAQMPVGAPNWRRGPEPPRRVTGVVLHVTEGTAASAAAWFANPLAEVSAHFLVTQTGAVWQFVGIHDVAYHAGRVLRATWPLREPGVNPNTHTVGIEHEGTGREPWPEAQRVASAALCAWLCRRFALIPSERTLPLHREIFAGKTCPGVAFDDFARAEHLGRVREALALVDASSLITGIR